MPMMLMMIRQCHDDGSSPATCRCCHEARPIFSAEREESANRLLDIIKIPPDGRPRQQAAVDRWRGWHGGEVAKRRKVGWLGRRYRAQAAGGQNYFARRAINIQGSWRACRRRSAASRVFELPNKAADSSAEALGRRQQLSSPMF